MKGVNMADNMLIDGLIKFCDEKSKNIKLKAEPQVFIEIKQALEEFKDLKEKSVTKKPLHQGYIYVCPCCNDKATIGSVFLRPNQKYCIDCGTEFDWQ